MKPGKLDETFENIKKERGERKEKYDKACKDLRTLLEKGLVGRLLRENQKSIMVFLKDNREVSTWEKIESVFSILKTALMNLPDVVRIAKRKSNLNLIFNNIGDPLMQKSVLEHDGVLKLVGRNADNF